MTANHVQCNRSDSIAIFEPLRFFIDLVRHFRTFEIEKRVNDVAAFETNTFLGKVVWRTFLLLIEFAQLKTTAQNFRHCKQPSDARCT